MAHSTHGRHRAPGRHNPVSELSSIVTRVGATGAKASAVLAVSGGLVAAFALPASAAPETTARDLTSAAPARPVAVPAAPAISAPAAVSPARAEVVGVVGVKAVAKPKPKPKPVVTVEQARAGRHAAVGGRATPSRTAPRTRSTESTSRTTARVPAPQTPPVTPPVTPSSSRVVSIARGLLGIAYVYGGSTPSGFDCSGFTQYVYNKAGITIPRTASAQQRAASRVTSPRPGDLVFYGSPASHVGIFTGGDMMIDSPKPGKFTSERNMYGTPTGFGRF